MEIREFIRELHLLANQESRFAFFIGAGCSYSSGIPTAGELVKLWLPHLKAKKIDNSQNINKWAKEYFKEEYDENKPSTIYAKVIKELFPHAKSRQQEIERLTEGKEPFLGYALLASLMGDSKYSERFNMILTTNFDDLIADALYLYANKRPRVIPHESLVSFASSSSKKPHVIKLHGDAQFEPKNTESEIDKLAEEVENVLKEILSERGIIFLGYGANDSSIIKLLSTINDRSLPWGVYWISQNPPNEKIAEWLEKRKATWVKHRDFDEFMLLLSEEFAIKPLDRTKFEKRFEKMMDGNHDAIKKIQKKISKKPESEIKIKLNEALKKIIDESEDWFQLSMKANDAAKNNPDEAIQIYELGIKKFQNNSNLLGYYGDLLYDIFRYDESLLQYTRALEIDPDNPTLLNNKGLVLDRIHKYEEALEYYDKSLEIRPDFSITLGNKGLTLYAMYKFEKALEYYDKALEIDPDDSTILNNKGLVLDAMYKYEEALEYYDKALGVEPNDTISMVNKGAAFENMGKYEEALECYNKTLEIKPNEIFALSHKAYVLKQLNKKQESEACLRKILAIKTPQRRLFYLQGIALIELEKYKEALEYLDKELELNPKNVSLLNRKGFALSKIGKYEEAEKCFNSALEINPLSVDVLYNMASLMSIQNYKIDALDLLDDVMNLDPWIKVRLKITDFENIKNDPKFKKLIQQ